MKNIPITIKYKVDEYGELDYHTATDQTRKGIFKSTLKKGDIVEVTYQIHNADYSVAQLDKVHKCIRQLAVDMGYDFEEMKKLVKQRAGLYLDIREGTYKSFADCTKDEISEAIKAAISIGEFSGVNLSNY